MPIYEFRCFECSEVFEVLVPRPGDGVEPCPQCGSGRTEKLLSVAAGIVSRDNAGGGCPFSSAEAMGQGGCCCSAAGGVAAGGPPCNKIF